MANSSHIYERDIDNAQKKIFYDSECNVDRRGYFTISTENNSTIRIQHFNYENEMIHQWSFEGPTIDTEVMDEMSFYVTDVHHAMYLMKEICTAASCIKEGRNYVQDETKLFVWKLKEKKEEHKSIERIFCLLKLIWL